MKLHRIRIGTDIHMNVRVTESGIPIDWNNTQAVALVVKNMANSSPYTVSRFDNHTFAKCATTASATDRTVLDVCLPAKEQLVRCLPAECDYRVIVTVKHDGATASYDALAFTLVPSSDLAGPPEESEDPINLNLQLEEITSSEIKRMVEEATWLLNTTVASEAERQFNEGVRQENERQRMEEFGGIKDELVRLTETANEAAEAAQTAKTEANEATDAAYQAMRSANTAASNANTEARNAKLSASDANSAANNANDQAGRAATAATSAETATVNANTAKDNAITATTNAVAAATAANDAADRANAAAEAVEPYENRLEHVEGKVTELEDDLGNLSGGVIALDLRRFEKSRLFPNDDGVWAFSGDNKIVIPVNVGEKYIIKTNVEYSSYYSFLKSYNGNEQYCDSVDYSTTKPGYSEYPNTCVSGKNMNCVN